MSSSKTANLQLNQWAAGDAFLREEFNSDNSKVDAKFTAIDNKAYVVGKYFGTEDMARPTVVTLGFAPTAVLVGRPGFWECSAFVGAGQSISYSGQNHMKLTNTGFEVGYVRVSAGVIAPYLNSAFEYVYVAFR